MKPPARILARALGPALLAAVLAAPAVTLAAPPTGFAFRCSPDTLRASEEGAWELDVRLVNETGRGVYCDSLVLVVVPAGEAPGGPGSSVRRLPMPESLKSVSAGDSLVTRVSVGASAAHARLEIRLYAHGPSGDAFEASGLATASGSVLESLYPATLVRDGGRVIEIVKVPAPAEVANGAGVLLMPGEGSDARAMLVPAARLAREGVSVVLVSAPGRGGSQGPDDFAGPASRAGALAALDTLLRLPGVDRTRIGAWGVSRGGTLALLLALEKPRPFAVVAAQAACYDVWSAHRAATPAGRAAIEAAAGRDSAGWRTRSPLLRAREIGGAVLVYHGERDPVFPPGAARSFAAAVEAAGGVVVTRLQPSGGHDLPVHEAVRFLQSRLSAPR